MLLRSWWVLILVNSHSEGKKYTLKEILEDLLSNISEIKGAAVVSVEGFPLESIMGPNIDEIRIAAMTAAILSLGERAAQELQKGFLEQIFIRGINGFLFVMSAGENAVLVVDTEKNVKLGLLFLECQRACKKIADIVW